MSEFYIAWWNLENLFDVYDSVQRPAWLQRELGNELAGWDKRILDTKVAQLVKIIRKMNQGRGPDVLGVCEVENRPVLDLLLNRLNSLRRNYKVAHHDTKDKRGIDVAFIYDGDKFTLKGQYSHVVLKRTASRDLFQVNLRTSSGSLLIFIGNHWPSRRGGEYHTEPYRIIAAETLSYWNERIFEIIGDDAPIVVMGDFNDEPYNRSVTEYALATNSRTKVLNSRIPRLLNLMWPFPGKGLGTHYYLNFPNVLDQFMVSKGIASGRSGFKVKKHSDGNLCVEIEMFEEMVSGGDYPAPLRFGRPSAKLNENGFSDHYPISMILEGDLS